MQLFLCQTERGFVTANAKTGRLAAALIMFAISVFYNCGRLNFQRVALYTVVASHCRTLNSPILQNEIPGTDCNP